MISLGKIGSIAYYTALSAEDYWARENPVGRWYGSGAQALGLSGQVRSETLERLFAGVSPDGTRALVMNAGSPTRCIGWDLTASVPKSFSTLWSQADAADRLALERVQELAVEETIAHLEENAAFVRTGKGGERFERAGVVIAAFQHATSRNLDPNIHTHLLLLNLGVTDRQSTHALYSPLIYDNKIALGSCYRSCLAYHLQQELGLSIERRDDFIEIEGVPKDLMQAFSSRRKTIEETMEANGWTSAKAAALVALTTRQPKVHLSQDVLLARWQEVGHSFGFGTPEATHLLHHRPRHIPFPAHDPTEIIAGVTERLAARETFTNADIVRAIALEAAGRGIDRLSIKSLRREFVASDAVACLAPSLTVRYVLTEPPEHTHRHRPDLTDLAQHPEVEPEREWEPI